MQIQRRRPYPLDGGRIRVYGLCELCHLATAAVVQLVELCLDGILPVLIVIIIIIVLQTFRRQQRSLVSSLSMVLSLVVSLVRGLAPNVLFFFGNPLGLETDLVDDKLGLDAVQRIFVADALCQIIGLQVGMLSVSDLDPDVDGRPLRRPFQEPSARQVLADGPGTSSVFAIAKGQLFALKDTSGSHDDVDAITITTSRTR